MNPKLDLVLERIVDITPEQMWKAWTDPEQLKIWFTPAPWKVTECRIDLRSGGEFYVMMSSPEGQASPCNGCYLELIENRKLVWTDALISDYRPSEKPFMTAVITFEPHGSGTKYKVIVRHKNEEDRFQHENMGFIDGWSVALEQLVVLAKSLK